MWTIHEQSRVLQIHFSLNSSKLEYIHGVYLSLGNLHTCNNEEDVAQMKEYGNNWCGGVSFSPMPLQAGKRNMPTWQSHFEIPQMQAPRAMFSLNSMCENAMETDMALSILYPNPQTVMQFFDFQFRSLWLLVYERLVWMSFPLCYSVTCCIFLWESFFVVVLAPKWIAYWMLILQLDQPWRQIFKEVRSSLDLQ